MMSSVATEGKLQQAVSLQGVDPETCMIVFKNHWAQVVKILEKHDPLKNTQAKYGSIPPDEASAVQNYVEHMLFLLIEEQSKDAAMGPILEFVVSENIMEKLFLWSLRREFTDETKIEQLRMYEMLVTQSHQPLLHHKPILKPLMMLLSSCSGTTTPAVEGKLVVLLNQLCSILAKDPSILELFFHTSEDQGATNFLIFSLLIPFIHREGAVGQQARDALLFIMSLSAENSVVAHHIVENTYFCPVTVEEVMTTTAYLDLFLRSISEPALLEIFLRFILLHQHENVHILDTLTSRINTPFRLCVVSLALFRTLISLHCEDVMLQLVLRYLVPCSHMMLSQRRAVKERDWYSVSAAKLLALTPVCCSSGITLTLGNQERDYILWSKCAHDSSGPAVQPLPEGASALARGEDASALDVSYLQYLWEAHANILGCVRDCRAWSARYDGDSPEPDAWLGSQSGESARSAANPVFGLPQQLPRKAGPPPAPGKEKSQAELEWDDSYDAGISSGAGAGEPSNDADSSGPPAPIDPPKHIQEMKKNAILLFKGSYIEESDFQDDVMVYRLCAEKDSDDTRSSREDPVRPPTQAQPEVQSPPPNNGPLPGPQPETDSEGEHSRDSSDLFENTPKEPKQESGAEVAPGSNPESAAPTAEAERRSDPTVVNPGGEDFVAQYDEIIKELDSGSEGLLGRYRSPPDTLLFTKEPVGKEEESRGDKEDEDEGEKEPDEEEDDFDAFITETPAEETAPSPFGVRAETAFAGHVPGRTQSTPFTGPFISVVLSKLENMLENSLHVNLLLIGIITQLASYPQPLLRSFLLNTNMVFQPSVRSLYQVCQVLASVKNKIEQFASVEQDFPGLLIQAQQYLLFRVDLSDLTPESLTKDPNQDASRTGSGQSLLDGPPRVPQPFLTHRATVAEPPPSLPLPVRNAMLAAALFPEFLKELAALAQEHSILCCKILGDSEDSCC
ncbi:FHF complex subunit HOOK-interacting protein 1A isoform X3 [Manis pentadactyla]|uniref:FHF complex subunit HOOK-interacting protein 1A isoform X3 n=1 Tax=Manis pentadactyla TaxID=143292 RepID=UPI00255C5067|nr:FHF complex subunit HOOK-interacting protein 1A isoform X3 [Manis pentadactyla]